MLVMQDAEREEDLILMIGAMSLESFAERLENYPREKLAVVVGDRWDIQNLAIREGVRVLIVTGGLGVEPKTLEAVEEEGRKFDFITARHGHNSGTLPRGGGGAAHVERGISLLARRRVAGNRASQRSEHRVSRPSRSSMQTAARWAYCPRRTS